MRLLAFQLAVVVLLASCASVPPDPRIAELQSQLDAFVTGSELSAYGEDELKRAEGAVRRLSNENLKAEEFEVALYEARRLLEIAEFSARARFADKQREALAAERERLVLMARTREAEEARADAAAAQALKETALAEAKAAELAKAEAEAARLSATEQQREAEEAATAARAQAEAAKLEAAAAREEIESMRSRLAQLEARPTERGLLLTLGDVLFAFNKADLKAGVERTLMPLANVLKEKPEQTVVVEGHTDSVGSRDYNLQLSERRAESVRDFLVDQGVEPARISVDGLGPDFPIADNADEAGRQRNRRVDVILPNVETQ